MWASTSLQKQKALTQEEALPTRPPATRRHRQCPGGTSACTGGGRCPTKALGKTVNSAECFARNRHRGWPEDVTPSYRRTGSKIFRTLSCHSGGVLPRHCSSPAMPKGVVSPPLFRGALLFCFPQAAWEAVGKWMCLREVKWDDCASGLCSFLPVTLKRLSSPVQAHTGLG